MTDLITAVLFDLSIKVAVNVVWYIGEFQTLIEKTV